MAPPVLGLYQAAGFMLGCMAIHSLRAHAERLTPALIGVAILLASILVVDRLSTIPNTFDPDGPEVRAITGFE